jgi:hypothetical protein
MDRVDPFLSAHNVAPFCFDLSGSYVPASIRDQMLRGMWMASRLFAEGVVEADSRVLTVGAGVAGATAAIVCAKYGAKVDLIEKSGGPFYLQRSASSRWLDPTQYDFPLDHWQKAQFPWVHSVQVPLSWRAGFATSVVLAWDEQLENYRAKLHPRLEIKYYSKLIQIVGADRAQEKDYVAAEIECDGAKRREHYSAVLLCHGFGKEKCCVTDYDSVPFWSEGGPPALPRTILISGDGDGALQEFILTVTNRRSAKEVFEAIIPNDIRSDLQRNLHSAEDQAQRAFIWSAPEYDHEIFNTLEKSYLALIDRLLSNDDLRTSVAALVRPETKVTLAHLGSHFGRAYALNRFLCLLILRATEKLGTTERCHNTRVESNHSAVDAKVHVCDKNKVGACWGYPHCVHFVVGERVMATASRIFDYCIFRHGVEGAPKIQHELSSGPIEELKPLIRREILPYSP